MTKITIQAVDTHTAGEPTRIVLNGGPDLGRADVSQRLESLRSEHDWLRKSLIGEPRGYAWLVGALLLEPIDPSAVAGVIFFNNTGYLGMCGHGLIGVVEALAHAGRIQSGEHVFETPVGLVSAQLHEDRLVTIANVESFRWRKDVEVRLANDEVIVGDVAYGGNWFFLSSIPSFASTTVESLVSRTREIRNALEAGEVRGADGAVIDHIELCGPPVDASRADGRNFVLCPGGEYDRSPCGTGTSAKVACLAADGLLQPGEVWRQESIIGGLFEASYVPSERAIKPRISARAFVTGESTWVLDDQDPYRFGIGPSI